MQGKTPGEKPDSPVRERASRSYADITPLEPEWLWHGYLPRAETVIVAGDGGVGKGFLMADLAARVTRGSDMPDGSEGAPAGSVIMVTVEDDPELAMAYRLRAAGAVLSKIYDMTGEFTVPDSLPALREEIEAIGDVRLVILDPLAAVASCPITAGNVRIRRTLMMPLERLAKETGITLLAVHHTVKSGRTAGAKAITDTARQVLRVTRASDERIRLITVEKSNIACDAAPECAYTVAGETQQDVRAIWVNHTEDRERTTAERILAVLEDASSPLETQEVARLSGVAYPATHVALTRLKDKRRAFQPKRGSWALVTPERLAGVAESS